MVQPVGGPVALRVLVGPVVMDDMMTMRAMHVASNEIPFDQPDVVHAL